MRRGGAHLKFAIPLKPKEGLNEAPGLKRWRDWIDSKSTNQKENRRKCHDWKSIVSR